MNYFNQIEKALTYTNDSPGPVTTMRLTPKIKQKIDTEVPTTVTQ